MADQHVTIDVLPNDVLLHIFLCHRPVTMYCYDRFHPSYCWQWYALAHVCRRWRHLIFASPRHLGLRLISGSKHKTAVDCWPALPIFLRYDQGYTPHVNDEERLFAVLKHHDRIHEMSLTMTSWMFAKSTAWVELSFPELQGLNLRSPYDGYDNLPVLPDTFLNGLTSPNQLRHVRLENLSVPAFPQFLAHSRNLVSLFLDPNFVAGEEFPSPEALVAALSTTTQLRLLSLRGVPNSRPKQGSAQSPPQDLTGLPSLITLIFRGSVGYLEDIVSKIHAPLVKQLSISASFYQRRAIEVPQLSEFISRTKELSSSPIQTYIHLSSDLSIRHSFEGTPPQCPQWEDEEEIFLSLGCMFFSWEMSQATHICRQSSPLLSSLRRLNLSTDQYFSKSLDPTSWLQFLEPFNGVEILGVCDGSHVSPIARALHQSTMDMALEVLPALRTFVRSPPGMNTRTMFSQFGFQCW